MITHESSLHDYTGQIKYVLENYSNHGLKAEQFDHVVMGGLGGSGIGAAIAKNWFFDKFSRPIETINDYHLPSYVNEKSLVILNSYSGNTEETLSLFEEAKSAGAKILTLSSGGKLTELASENDLICYPLQTGFQPRMTIGFGLSYLTLILGELMGTDERSTLESIIEELEENRSRHLASAEQMFEFFKNSLKHKFVILSDRHLMPIAIRFSQQINENAKLEAFVNAVPESNHNVLESYTDRLPTNFVLLHTDQNPRVAARFDFLASHLEMDNNKILPLMIPEYRLYTIYDLIYRLDWVSIHMANELDAPLMEVPMISDLKEFLTNLEIIEAEDEDEA